MIIRRRIIFLWLGAVLWANGNAPKFVSVSLKVANIVYLFSVVCTDVRDYFCSGAAAVCVYLCL